MEYFLGGFLAILLLVAFVSLMGSMTQENQRDTSMKMIIVGVVLSADLVYLFFYV